MEFLTKLERLDFGCNELEELVSSQSKFFLSVVKLNHGNKTEAIPALGMKLFPKHSMCISINN